MARRKETRPTTIYWLLDTRTGIPFYCGKTVLPPHQRLACHKREAAKGERRVHVKVRECGANISIHEMESVPVDGDWAAREKRWIYILRQRNSDCCNTNDGGAGATGRIISAETRAKLSAIFKGKSTHTPETRAHLSAIGMGRKRSPESIEKSAAGLRGKKHSPESIAHMSAGQKGRKRPPHTDEHKEKIRVGNTGKKRTPEQIERVSKGQKAAHYARQRARGVCASSFLCLPC